MPGEGERAECRAHAPWLGRSGVGVAVEVVADGLRRGFGKERGCLTAKRPL